MYAKKFLFVSTLLFGVLSFNSCSKDAVTQEFPPAENPQEIQKGRNKIPYASENDFVEFSSNKEIIPYTFSREMALIDLKDFKKGVYQNQEDLTLSELPVIVYDDNKIPKFYEFIVLTNDGTEVGTITTFARKEVPGFTAYVLPFVRDYNNENARRYSDTYPYTSEKNETALPVSAMKVLSEEELLVKQEAKEFWEDIDNPKQSNDNVSAFIRAWSQEYIIPQFNNDSLQRTRWNGDCGPSALAWLYRAYYPRYNGVHYPLHGGVTNENVDFRRNPSDNNTSLYGENNQLYRDLAERCGVGYGMDPFKPATFPSDLVKAANETFPNHLLISSPGGRSFPRQHIEANRPAVLLIRSGVRLHYVVAFGTKNRYNTYNFGLFKVRKVHTDSWLFVSDNGATTSSNGYLPYYMNTHTVVGKDFRAFILFGRR